MQSSTSKEITMGHAGRLKIKAGIDKAADAVKPTLGVVGMSAIIEWPGLDPIECDDGVTILKNLEFKDKYEQLGLLKLRKAAIRTSIEGGDGTATTTVLTQALINEAFKEIANDSSKIREVKERLTKGLAEVLEKLSKIKSDVKDEDIERIATISSLDPEVAKLIAEIIKEVGVNGVVTVEKGSKLGYSKEVVKGARFDRGLLSPYFINDFEQERCVLENPYIFLADRKISINEQIKNLMDSVHASGHKSILIVADDVDGMALASFIQSNNTVTTVVNNQQRTGTFSIACVRNPYTGTRATDFLWDLAALTGAKVISESAGMKLDQATVNECGRAEKVIVTKDNCTIIGGHASEALEERVKAIQKKTDETTSEYERVTLQERLAQLTGGIGVVRVGAYTDTEFNAKKYKFDNAINATQAALQEGILPGGGVALATLQIDEVMFRNVLVAPLIQMAKNAGMDWYKVLATVQIQKGLGYDFKSKELVNMLEAGIIDPYKVVRLALESATAIALSLVGIEVSIVQEVEEPQFEVIKK